MSSPSATQGIFITGHPLTEAVYIPNPSPDEGDEGEWLLNIPQAEIILNAWVDASAEKDVIRSWERFEIGMLVTALAMEGEISISGWESVTGADGTDIYSTGMMPFDFEVTPVHH